MSSYSDDLYQSMINEGMSEEEIESAIKQKKREFGGFMTVQGMLFLIAKEHGISLQNPDVDPQVYSVAEEEIDYDEFTIPIQEVKEGMVNIVIIGKITKNFPLHEFSRNDGSVGIVGSFILQDSSGQVKVVAWDEKVKPLQSEYSKEGTLMRVIGGYSKMGKDGFLEVHVGKKGKLVLSPEDLNTTIVSQLDGIQVDTKVPKISKSVPLGKLMDENKFIPIIEGIIHIEEFKEVTLKSGEKTFLLKLILTDSYEESARIVIWGENAVDALKSLEEDNAYQFRNVMVKDNSYTKEKELSFTRKSSFCSV